LGVKGFQKGTKKSPLSGRKKGVPNKDTAKIRGFIIDILDEQGEKLKTELAKLEGKDYIQAVTALLPYAVARLQAIELTNKEQVAVKILNINPLASNNGAEQNSSLTE